MSKVPNANLPVSTGDPSSYERILNTKLNEHFRAVKETVNRHEDGYLFPSYTTTVDYTPTLNDSLILVNAASAKVDITFRPPGEWGNKRYTIKKIDASANTVKGVGTIDGISNWVTTTQYASQEFESDGTNIWKV